METTLQGNSQASRHVVHANLARGMGWGLTGGLFGMLAVDLLLMGALSIVGLSPLTCFSAVGNTVARFFSILGIDMAGGFPLGVATHYLVGPVLGVIFGAAVARVGALRLEPPRAARDRQLEGVAPGLNPWPELRGPPRGAPSPFGNASFTGTAGLDQRLDLAGTVQLQLDFVSQVTGMHPSKPIAAAISITGTLSSPDVHVSKGDIAKGVLKGSPPGRLLRKGLHWWPFHPS